ncbi:MAG: hypothetical protein IPK62_03940 [Bacteroidetes bacterium]|nr:hypothetical protein [Bacteroidota bacterium]
MGNGGITFDNFLNNGVKNAYLSNVASGPFQMVSPFLTGRRYSGGNNWEDDELDNNNVLANPLNSDNILGFKDQDLKGLFFVNDPHNNNLSAGQIDGDYPKLHDQKWGFNDLERRKKDLCILLSMSYNGPANTIPAHTLQLVALTDFIPLPQGAH